MDCGGDDDFDLCQKIINEIDSVFEKDPGLSGFEIIPLLSNQNKSPVIHVEHNLGLESWCIKHVYMHVHRFIIDSKMNNQKFLYCDNLVKYLNCAILINPDCTTFWNIRRQLVEKNRLNISKEFQFSSIVLYRKPKSAESFAYRRWLFLFQSESSIDWTIELRLCEKCGDKNTSNYHAWTHRQWVVQKTPDLLKYEIFFTEKFIRKHISDYCCYHHRQFIFKLLINSNLYMSDDELDLKILLGYIKKIQDQPSRPPPPPTPCLDDQSVASTSSAPTAAHTSNSELSSAVAAPAPTTIHLDDEMTNLNNSLYENLLKFLLPNINFNNLINNNEIILNKFKLFLYFMNLLIYDMKLINDLKKMYGRHETFINHYRMILTYIVNYCNFFNNHLNNFTDNHDCNFMLYKNFINPSTAEQHNHSYNDDEKHNNIDERNNNIFLEQLITYEYNNGDDDHKKWSQIHFRI